MQNPTTNLPETPLPSRICWVRITQDLVAKHPFEERNLLVGDRIEVIESWFEPGRMMYLIERRVEPMVYATNIGLIWPGSYDRIDPPTLTTSQAKCQCPTATLMASGCRCGAISPSAVGTGA